MMTRRMYTYGPTITPDDQRLMKSTLKFKGKRGTGILTVILYVVILVQQHKIGQLASEIFKFESVKFSSFKGK